MTLDTVQSLSATQWSFSAQQIIESKKILRNAGDYSVLIIVSKISNLSVRFSNLMKDKYATSMVLRYRKQIEMPRKCSRGRPGYLGQIIGIVLALSTTNADAQSSIVDGIETSITNEHFIVSGKSLFEIRRELDRRGPRGRWALTAWNVYWNQKCDVRFEATVTLPRVVGLWRLQPRDRDKVEDMLLALELHEKVHLRTGLFAAEEVKRYACKDPKKIINYWIMKNDQLDRETQNGRTEGVKLN